MFEPGIRRSFVCHCTGIAIMLCLSIPSFSQVTRNINVYLRSNTGQDTMWDGNMIRVFGITDKLSASPEIPAKTIYCNEGDTVVLKALSISQTDHHTIHLHGLDVDTRNDGDPMTSFWLEHMEDTTYTFIARNAGTYLYHCHVGDVVHVQMGMYGLIVVKAANETNTAYTGGPAFNRSYNWLLSEVDKAWHDTIPVHDPLADTIHLPPYLPDYFLINGKSETDIPGNDSIEIDGAENEIIYLRIGSIGFYYNRIIFPSFLNAKIIDSDGRPLPYEINTDSLVIAPGERYGVLLNPLSQDSATIEVQYLDMNTDSIWNSQFVPVVINGILSKEELNQTDKIHFFEIVPNPNTGNFTLEINNLHEISDGYIIITDLTGRELYKGAIDKVNSVSINLTLETGMYFCRLVSGSNNLLTEKLIIKR